MKFFETKGTDIDFSNVLDAIEQDAKDLGVQFAVLEIVDCERTLSEKIHKLATMKGWGRRFINQGNELTGRTFSISKGTASPQSETGSTA